MVRINRFAKAKGRNSRSSTSDGIAALTALLATGAQKWRQHAKEKALRNMLALTLRAVSCFLQVSTLQTSDLAAAATQDFLSLQHKRLPLFSCAAQGQGRFDSGMRLESKRKRAPVSPRKLVKCACQLGIVPQRVVTWKPLTDARVSSLGRLGSLPICAWLRDSWGRRPGENHLGSSLSMRAPEKVRAPQFCSSLWASGALACCSLSTPHREHRSRNYQRQAARKRASNKPKGSSGAPAAAVAQQHGVARLGGVARLQKVEPYWSCIF